jgi:predicted nucleic acid-binding protein
MPETPERPEARPSIILDTTVLSNFAAVGQIPLLERLYRDQACTTLMVAEEMRAGLDAGYWYLQSVAEALSPLWSTGWLPVLALESVEEQTLYVEFATFLGPGEASCLAVAITRGLTLASDDLAARRTAARRGVRLTGTIGILIRLVCEGHLPLAAANSILAQMITLRYRAPVERLDDFI